MPLRHTLLFGIDRDGRLVAITELFDPRIDVFKLHVTVRMGRTLPRFLVGMKAEADQRYRLLWRRLA